MIDFLKTLFNSKLPELSSCSRESYLLEYFICNKFHSTCIIIIIVVLNLNTVSKNLT